MTTNQQPATNLKNKFSLVLALALGALLGLSSARAGTHTWNGGGSDEFWSNPSNWTGGQPLVGEAAPVVIIFNSGVTTTNNIAGLTVDSLQFLADNVRVFASGSGSLNIRGGNSSTNLLINGTVNLEANLPLSFSGTNLCIVAASKFVNIYGVVSGSGEIIWDGGGGTVEYRGTAANTFSGTTRLRNAGWQLNKPAGVNAIAGPVALEKSSLNSLKLELLADNQIADTVPVTIESGKSLFALSLNEKIGSLTFNGGIVNLVYGLLTLGGNVFVNTNNGSILNPVSLGGVTRTFQVVSNASSSIDDVISDGGAAAGLNLTGGGRLFLSGTNTFTGLVQVTNSILQIENNFALGSSAAGTFIDSNSALFLSKVSVAAESLTLAGALNSAYSTTNSWAGNITLLPGAECSVDLGSLIVASGALSGSGPLLKTGGGSLLLAGSSANSYSGGTEIQQGLLLLSKTNATAIPGALKFSGEINNKEVRLLFPNQIANTAAVTLTNKSVLNLNNNSEGVGSLSGSSTSIILFPAMVALGTGTLTNSGNSLTTFGGAITGTGPLALVKSGVGTLTLTGSNTCTGACLLNQGTLTVNSVLPGAITQGANTYLTGTGTVGQVTCNSGFIQPAGLNQGTLKTGGLFFNSSSAAAFMELGLVTNDVLDVTGSVTLNNCFLGLDSYTAGKIGKKFTLIANDGADAISGTFSGLPEGANIPYGSLNYTISYVGGTGNDVVLTQTTQPAGAQITNITRQVNGQINIAARGENGVTFDMQANTNLMTTNWVSLGTVYSDGFGNVSFTDTNAASFKQRFYRLVQQ